MYRVFVNTCCEKYFVYFAIRMGLQLVVNILGKKLLRIKYLEIEQNPAGVISGICPNGRNNFEDTPLSLSKRTVSGISNV